MKYEKFDILKKAKYSIIPNNRELYIVYVECDANDGDYMKDTIEFDIVEHEGKEFWINKKYIPKRQQGQGRTPRNNQTKKVKGISKVIDEQFRFHYDTTLIKKCPNVIHPNDLISITEKIHGTSGISAYVLCKQDLDWKQKIAKWLTGEEFNKYDYLYASRTVIKNQFYNKNVTPGFYGCDVWAEADKIVKPCLSKGMTAYYEIVGFLPNGGYIQKNYDYGCMPPKEGEAYTPEKHFKVRIYRVTITNVDGVVHEFSAREVQQWCAKVGLTPVEEWYYGTPKAHFLFRKKFWTFGLPARRDYYNPVIDIGFHALGWKDKWDSPRHEWDPMICITFFRTWHLLWIFNWAVKEEKNSITKSMATWEAILDYSYYNKTIDQAIDNHVWSYEEDGEKKYITIISNMTKKGLKEYEPKHAEENTEVEEW